MTEKMTKRERLMAAFAQKEVDRVPVGSGSTSRRERERGRPALTPTWSTTTPTTPTL